MRTTVRETAAGIALRNCSKEVVGEGQSMCDFGERGICAINHIFFQKVSCSLMKPLLVMRNSCLLKDFSAFLDVGRYKNWAHKIVSEDLSCHSTPHQLQAQSDSFLHSTLSSFQGVLKVSSV